MAFWKRKSRNKKKYSSSEKFAYHKKRAENPSQCGVAWGSKQQLYSKGFLDGWSNINNSKTMKANYGSAGGKAYNLGRARGDKSRERLAWEAYLFRYDKEHAHK